MNRHSINGVVRVALILSLLAFSFSCDGGMGRGMMGQGMMGQGMMGQGKMPMMQGRDMQEMQTMDDMMGMMHEMMGILREIAVDPALKEKADQIMKRMEGMRQQHRVMMEEHHTMMKKRME